MASAPRAVDHSKPSKDPTSPLGQFGILPLEVRKQIYGYCLSDVVVCKSVSPVNSHTPDLWSPPALLYASKFMHEELVDAIYDDKTFVVEIQILTLDRAVQVASQPGLSSTNSSPGLYPPLRKLSKITLFRSLEPSRIKNIDIKVVFGYHKLKEIDAGFIFKELKDLAVRYRQKAVRYSDWAMGPFLIDIDSAITSILTPLTGQTPAHRRATLILQTHNHPGVCFKRPSSELTAPDIEFLYNKISRTIRRFRGFNTVAMELHSSNNEPRVMKNDDEDALWKNLSDLSAGRHVLYGALIAWFWGLGEGTLDEEPAEGYDVFYDGELRKTSREGRVVFRPIHALEKRRRKNEKKSEDEEENGSN